MTTTERIKALEDQLKNLQVQLNNLNNTKLEVIRSFTGEIFSPFEGTQYRRLLSNGICVWEKYDSEQNNWVLVSDEISKDMETLYKNNNI